MTRSELTAAVPALRRFAYSLTGSMADADDLLQSTLERALSRPAPEGVEAAKWLFRICRNLWIDEYRARKVRNAVSHDPEIHGQTVDGERAMTSEIELEQVNTAMAQLPDEQRSVIALVAVQGLSYREVAATLEIPIGTVMSRLARARATLSQLLNAAPARIIA